MVQTKTLLIPAQISQLALINEQLEAELESCDCPMRAMMQIQLAVEEIFVNIANYAYQPGTGDAEITIDVTGHTLVMRFRDFGVPFDPLKKEDADVTLSAEDREIGGLGIYLVKKNMDDVSYVYENGANCLTIRKNW